MKKERGAITILTLVTILFIISFLVSTFVIIANRRQAQAEIKSKTQEIYEEDVKNIDNIYKGYFASESDTIPISTPEQLFCIATDKFIAYGDKIYICKKDADYELVNNISFKVNDYISDYSGEFQDSTNWIDIEQQKEKGVFTGKFEYNGNEILETTVDDKIIKHINGVSYISYIESTGTQYIDTGFYPTSNTMVRLKFNMTSPTGYLIFGYYVAENNSFRLFNYNNQAYLDYGAGAGYNRIYGGTLAAGTTYNIEFGNRYVKNLDTDVNIISNTAVSFSTKTNKAGIFGDGASETSSGKLYYCQVYDNSILVRDFKPALDNDNIPCLYDTVTEQYFYNAGSGTFNYQ